MSYLIRDVVTRLIFSSLGDLDVDFYLNNIINLSWGMTKFSFKFGKSLFYLSSRGFTKIYSQFKCYQQNKNKSTKINQTLSNCTHSVI